MRQLRFVGSDLGRIESFSPTQLPITIGRNQKNSVSIDDDSIAEHHCSIIQDSEQKMFILDMESSDGTFVNGNPVQRMLLQAADLIQVGNTKMVFENLETFAKKSPLPEVACEQSAMADVGVTTILMSHRINNVLQGINGGAHLVEVGLRNGDLQLVAKGWKIVETNQSKMSAIFLGLTKLGRPFVHGKTGKCDLHEITRDAMVQTTKHWDSAETQCSIGSTSRLPIIEGDIEALQLAINNLLGVAMYASRLESIRLVKCQLDHSGSDVTLQITYRGAAICL